MSYNYPSISLGSITLQDWDKLREIAREKGKPYADREETIAVLTRRRDWVISICRMYRKGVWQLTLDAIRNPFKKEEKLRELKPKDWLWAKEKAKEILEELK